MARKPTAKQVLKSYSDYELLDMAERLDKFTSWCQGMQDKYPRKFKARGLFRKMTREQRSQYQRSKKRDGGDG